MISAAFMLAMRGVISLRPSGSFYLVLTAVTRGTANFVSFHVSDSSHDQFGLTSRSTNAKTFALTCEQSCTSAEAFTWKESRIIDSHHFQEQ